jgi:hypothetical protein
LNGTPFARARGGWWGGVGSSLQTTMSSIEKNRKEEGRRKGINWRRGRKGAGGRGRGMSTPRPHSTILDLSLPFAEVPYGPKVLRVSDTRGVAWQHCWATVDRWVHMMDGWTNMGGKYRTSDSGSWTSSHWMLDVGWRKWADMHCDRAIIGMMCESSLQ